MAGYIRQDTTNNIADGNIINAVDFDNEYNAIEAAFSSTTGHTHDGTSAEGAPITKVGPAQDVVVSTSSVTPKTDNVLDIGSSLLRFKDLWLSGNSTIGGTLGVTGLITASGGVSGAVTSSNVTITGGTINGTSVGATTASTGAFTTLSASGNSTIGGTLGVTGALTASGGVTGALTSSNVTVTGGTINGTSVGATTASTGAFTTLTSNSTTTLNGTTIPASVTLVSTAATQTLTNKTISGANNTLSNIGNASLTNSSVTVNGTSIALGASGTITAVNPNALTIGTGLSGTSYNGSAAVTVAIDSTVATLTGTQTLTNKTLTSPTINTATISGGTINNTVIGGTTRAAGSFTTLDANGNVVLGDATADTISANGRFNTDVVPSTTDARDLGTTTLQWKQVYATTFTEGVFPVVSQTDIGTAPNQIPLNQYLGNLAYQDADAIAGDLQAGSINNTPIGATTASTGAFTNLAYTGTLTGGTGVINIGSGQLYKDASGNVGIGTSSPAHQLDISGTSGTLRVTQALDVATAGLNLYGASNQGNLGRINIWQETTGAKGGFIRFDTCPTGTNTFTERMRIDSSGNLLVGTTSGVYHRFIKDSAGDNALQVANSSTNTTSSSMELNVNYTGNTSGWFVRGGDSGFYRFYIYSNGNMANANNSYGAISDAKLKENVTDATPKLEKLNQVRIVNFNIKGDEQKQLGVIAQELEQIFPGMVDESPDRDAEGNDLGTTTKSVKYSVFVPMLIKAIQEQQAIIEQLKARVEALEGTQP